MQENKQKSSKKSTSYDINARIREFCESEHIIQADLERLGINKSTVHMVWKDKQQPGIEFIRKMSQKFEDLNLSWLLKGMGPMKTANISGNNRQSCNTANIIYSRDIETQNIILSKDREIDKLLCELSDIREKYISLMEEVSRKYRTNKKSN
jgi:DNA-binding XRE family transcriptional regulator